MRRQIFDSLALVIATIVVAILAGDPALISQSCAQERDQVRAALFAGLDERFEQARAEEVPDFAPDHFAKAREFYQEAVAGYERGDRLENLRELLDQAATHLEAAFEFTRVAQAELADLIALRREAQQLPAGSERGREAFFQAEEVFRGAISRAEAGSMRMAKRIAIEAEASYREAILISLQEGPLRETEIRLERSSGLEQPEAYEKAAQDYERAQGLFRQARAEGIFAQEFLKLVKEIKWVTIGGSLLPDLTVELYDVPYSQIKGISPFPPLSDRPTTLSVLVKNVGMAAVDKSFSTELYVDGKLDTTFLFPSPAEMQDLQPHEKVLFKTGDTRVYSHSVTFSQGGKHNFRWMVDAKKQIQESDETEKSNVLDTTVVWQGAPDLVVEYIGPVGAAVGGQKSTWKIRVRNKGSGNAGTPFPTTFWPEAAGGKQEEFRTQSLAAGNSVVFTSTQSFRVWGKRKMRAAVDPNNFVAESNENNNELVKEFDLAKVDLAVTNFSFKQGNESTTFSFTVTNKGSGNATHPFKVRFWPGKMTGGSKWHPQTRTQPVLLTVNGLNAGQSASRAVKVALPAGDYPVKIEADYPDPDPVYFEENRNNNVFAKPVHLDEKYYVKIAKVAYTSFCKSDFYVWLDRSGSYWKGHTVLKLVYQNKVIHENSIPPSEISRGFIPGSDIDSAPDYGWVAKAKIVPYAGVGNKLIKSIAPETPVDVHLRARPKFTSLSPTSGKRGSKVLVTITGSNLVGPDNKAHVSVGFPKYEIIIGDDKIKATVKQASSTSVTAELDIASDAKLGKRAVWVSHCTPVYDHLSFEVVGAAPPAPAPSTKEVVVWLKKQPGPLYGGFLPYAGSIYPVANGVLQTITNVNTGLGKQWGVRIVKAGYTTNDCNKSKAVVDLAPGKSTSFFKGTNLSKGFPIAACIYPVQVAGTVAPNAVAVKVRFTK